MKTKLLAYPLRRSATGIPLRRYACFGGVDSEAWELAMGYKLPLRLGLRFPEFPRAGLHVAYGYLVYNGRSAFGTPAYWSAPVGGYGYVA